MADTALVQRVYRLFKPAPLTAEQESLYVDLQVARGHMDIVSRLTRTIELADTPAACQVLAGHKGSGKSTELFRLKTRLEHAARPMFVVYIQADESIDRNDVDFPDVLVAMIRQVAVQLKRDAGISLKPGYFKNLMQRLQSVLTTEIDFDSFDLDTGLLKLSGQLKGSPDSRAEIRKLLNPDSTSWLDAANEVIREAVLRLDSQGKAGLVVLMDDLDKMVVREHTGAGGKTDEYLFDNRAAQLTGFACHVVYTMPLSLAYSHHEQTIRNNFGGHVPVVPMTKIAERPPSGKEYLPGIEKFREVVVRRLQEAQADESQVFAASEVRDELIALSGGQPTELMTLVREAIIAGALPIDSRSLDRARFEGRREYARLLRVDHWPILEEIRTSGTYARTLEKELQFRELIESRAVLQYVDDEEWYALNPVVAGLTPPAERGPGLIL